MRDRVGRDEIFEAEDVLQHMLANDEARLGRIRAADVVEDAFKHFENEGAGAAGEIEHGDALMVGEALRNAKRSLQNIVYGTNDEIHDGRRRVIDPARLFHLGVVFGEKILVKIDEWIALEEAMLFLILRPYFAADRLALAERQILMNGSEVEAEIRRG